MRAPLALRILGGVSAFWFLATMPAAEGASPKQTGSECPVTATLAIVPGDAEGTAQLVLTLRIAEPWYIYTKSSRSTPLAVELTLPPGVATDGEWIRPKPRVVYQDERAEIYAGELTLRRALRVAPGCEGVVTATIRFQACDPTVCRPEEEIEAVARWQPKEKAP